MDSHLLTVSLGAWMELPNWKMSEWKDVGEDYGKRINVSMVAEYYQAYIKKMALEQYFSNDTVVTSVKKIKDCSQLCDPHCTTVKPTVNVKNGSLRPQFAQNSPSDDNFHNNTHYNDTKNDEGFRHETIFVQELEGKDQNGYGEKGSANTTLDSSDISCDNNSESASGGADYSPNLSAGLSNKNSLSLSKSSNTSGYGVSFTSSTLGSFPQRSNIPTFNRSMSVQEQRSDHQDLFSRTISLHNTKDALSATPVGKCVDYA